MGRGNIKQRNEIYAERSKTRKIARLHQEMGFARDDIKNIDEFDQAEDDCDKHIEQIKVNAKNVVMSLLLILVIFAIP